MKRNQKSLNPQFHFCCKFEGKYKSTKGSEIYTITIYIILFIHSLASLYCTRPVLSIPLPLLNLLAGLFTDISF
jgi:hypothetical protein